MEPEDESVDGGKEKPDLPPAKMKLTCTTELVEFDPHWEIFRAKHRDWFKKFGSPGDPLYALPKSSIQRLARCQPTSRPVIPDEARAAEEDLSELCEKFSSVGVWRNQSILYPYLRPCQPRLEKEQMEMLQWTAAQQRWAMQGIDRADDVNLRIKGYAGWLLTDPQFRIERDRLEVICAPAAGRDAPAGFRSARPVDAAGIPPPRTTGIRRRNPAH